MSELSNRQKRYLLLQKRHHLIVNLSRLLILILFLGLWEITSRLGMIDSFVFSSPAKIVRCFWSMVLDRSIFHHLGITLYETILSFLFVTGISILIAVILWYSKKLSEILDPYLVVLNSLPKSALAPLLIVWLCLFNSSSVNSWISSPLWMIPYLVASFDNSPKMWLDIKTVM